MNGLPRYELRTGGGEEEANHDVLPSYIQGDRSGDGWVVYVVEHVGI